VSALERLTARPRELERLRTDLVRYQEQQRIASQALDRLRQFLTLLADPTLATPLRMLQHDWEQRQQESSTQGSITRHQLEQKVAEDSTRTSSLRDFFQLFFRSRGRNFLLACCASMFW
jgi:hypothetical protein